MSIPDNGLEVFEVQRFTGICLSGMLCRVAGIAKTLKRLRGELTQDEVAERTGLTQVQISKYEQGVVPGMKNALRLAVGFGVSLDELMAGLNAAYDRDLSRHRAVEGSVLPSGGAVDPAAARAISEREAKHRRTLQEVRKLALTLVNALEGDIDDAVTAKNREAPTATAKGRGRHRRAG